jgi:hypothetical protein
VNSICVQPFSTRQPRQRVLLKQSGALRERPHGERYDDDAFEQMPTAPCEVLHDALGSFCVI